MVLTALLKGQDKLSNVLPLPLNRTEKTHLAGRVVLEIVVVGCNVDEPFAFDVCDSADVIARGQHKLLVQRPLRLVVQAGGGVQVHHLIVLHRQVVPRPLKVRHLTPQNGTLERRT